MTHKNSDSYSHVLERLEEIGTFIIELHLKTQTYPSYQHRNLWLESIDDFKKCAHTHARELAAFPMAKHETIDRLYDYLTQGAFAQMGLGWLEYGKQEGLINLDLIKADLKLLAGELYEVMGSER